MQIPEFIIAAALKLIHSCKTSLSSLQNHARIILREVTGNNVARSLPKREANRTQYSCPNNTLNLRGKKQVASRNF